MKQCPRCQVYNNAYVTEYASKLITPLPVLPFFHSWMKVDNIYNGDVRRLSVTLHCLTLTDDASGVSFVSYTGDVGYEVDSGRAGAVVGCGRSLVSSDLSHGGNLPHLASAPVLEKTLPGLGFWVATTPPSSIMECNTLSVHCAVTFD